MKNPLSLTSNLKRSSSLPVSILDSINPNFPYKYSLAFLELSISIKMGNIPDEEQDPERCLELKRSIAFDFLYDEYIKGCLKRRIKYFNKHRNLPHITTHTNDPTNRAYLRAHIREVFFDKLQAQDEQPISYSPILTMQAFMEVARTFAFKVNPHSG